MCSLAPASLASCGKKKASWVVLNEYSVRKVTCRFRISIVGKATKSIVLPSKLCKTRIRTPTMAAHWIVSTCVSAFPTSPAMLGRS